jgi:hypothetical protein
LKATSFAKHLYPDAKESDKFIIIDKNFWGLTLSNESSSPFAKVAASLKFVWIDISSLQSIIYWNKTYCLYLASMHLTSSLKLH